MIPIRKLPPQYRCESRAQRILYRATATGLALSVFGVTLAMLGAIRWLMF